MNIYMAACHSGAWHELCLIRVSSAGKFECLQAERLPITFSSALNPARLQNVRVAKPVRSKRHKNNVRPGMPHELL
ncbi:MAG TPA: hypothetical protein DCG37_08205 [Lachnospiraceae bacterium]|nr:hypothetical protein [Lachnospiraceae bacterium]